MPLPNDEQILSNAKEVLELFYGAFGPHPGYRPAHAKGQLLSGTFTPTAAAKSLSKAPQFQASSTPVLVRFSDSTGLPQIPDTDGNSKPNGIALRFKLGNDANGRRAHTDVIGHSTPHFPVPTGAQFAEFLKALGSSPPGTASPTPVEQFLGSHPAALRFVTAPKPFAASFGSQAYFALHAFKFVNSEGTETWVRYRFVPDVGHETISDEEAKGKSANYLFEEIRERVGKGPVNFKLVVQVGEDGDVTDDITNEWPDERKLVELGKIEIDTVVVDSDKEQKHVIFDPLPRVEGIEPSADPLLEFRAALYLLSGRERRAA